MPRKTILLLLVTLSMLNAALAQDDQKKTLERGRELTQQFYDEQLDVLFERFSPKMQEVLGGLEGLKKFRSQVADQLGKEKAIVTEDTETSGTYVRIARFEKLAAPCSVAWSIDKEGSVIGFVIRPTATEAPTKYLDYQTKTQLQLPFSGEWYVFWGGRTIAQNYHVVSQNQRFAYDFLVRNNRASHSGTGERNEDYYCFGKPILAPAAGTVLQAEGGVEDNVPGVMNPRQLLGNHVILDHGNGEYSVLAHLRQGTVKVKQGDRVDAEAELGECGNSGNSSEAHLHYHLQDAGEFRKGLGLPAPFVDYTANGKQIDRGEPTRGQAIQRSSSASRR